MPNTKHDLNGSDARDSAMAFYATIVNSEPRPQMDWTFEKDGSIHMKTVAKPTAGSHVAGQQPKVQMPGVRVWPFQGLAWRLWLAARCRARESRCVFQT